MVSESNRIEGNQILSLYLCTRRVVTGYSKPTVPTQAALRAEAPPAARPAPAVLNAGDLELTPEVTAWS